jgi:acyl-CoA synthetase (AMP-forming)/AMP-acid ligase II
LLTTASFIDLLYGAAKIGAIFAPLNWRLTARELAYIVSDCQPRAIWLALSLLACGRSCARLQVEHYLSIEGAH